MRMRALRYVISALVNGALLSACAAGGSSVIQSAGTVPAAVLRGAVPGGQAPAGRQAHSAVRRTMSTPACSGTGPDAFVGGGGSNVAGGGYSFVGGGQGNEACDSWSAVAGGFANVVSGGGDDSFIGGGQSNNLMATADSAIVAGNNNTISKSDAAIVGGQFNSTAAANSLIGGGETNQIESGGTYGGIVSGNLNNLSAEYGFIGAGISNTVSGEGGYIAAGGYNTVSGEGAVVDGGFNSTASGMFATIPGGYVNSAGGTYSFAAGARASAAQTGTFVWSDGSDGDTILTSSRAYQFLARASGGVTFWTNAASTVGASLAPGSGTWASASDRNLKTDVARIDDAAVLDKVAKLPIERWSYKSERGVRHVGPMAQDFYAAFKVGEDDKHITSIDEDGIALSAIKALHAHVMALDSENAQLRAEVGLLRTQVTSIRAEIHAAR
jgi:trimeric autotransporter adhesin